MDKKHSYLLDLWNSSKNFRRSIEEEWLINYMSYKKSNKIYILTNTGVRAVDVRNLQRNEEMKTNKIFPVVRKLISQILSVKPLFSPDLSNLKGLYDFDARVIRALVMSKYKELEKKGIIEKMAMHYVTTGMFVVKLFFNKNKGKEKMLSDGLKIREGEIEIVPIPIFNIVFDTSSDEFEDCKWAIHRVVISKKEADRIFGKNVKGKIIRKNDNVETFSTIPNNNDDLIEIFEYIEKEGNLIHFTTDEILSTAENPTPKGRLPYIVKKAFETDEIYSDSLISYARPLMKEYIARRKQLGDHAKKFGKPILVVDKHAKFKEDVLSSGKTIMLKISKNTGVPPQYLQPAEFSQYFYQNLGMIKEETDDILGIHDVSRGKVIGSRTPASTLAIMKSADDTMNAPFIMKFYYGLEEVFNLYIDFVRDKYTTKRLISYFDKSDYIYAEYVGNKLKENIKIQIKSVFGLSDNRAVRQQQIERLLALRMITKTEAKELLDFGELEMAYGTEDYDRIRANIENDNMSKLQYAIVDLYENHLVHIREHIKKLRKGDLVVSPDMKQEEIEKIIKIKSLLYKHIDDHWYAIATLLKQNILQAGLVLGIEKMSEVELQLFQVAINQIQMNMAKRIQEETGTGEQSPPQTQEEAIQQQQEIEQQAKGIGAMPPDTGVLQDYENYILNQIKRDIFGITSNPEGEGGEVNEQNQV